MKGARALAGSSAVAAAGLLLLLLGLCAAAADGDARHNVLELFPTARLRHSAVGRRSKGAITITYNNTQLTGSGEWVRARGGRVAWLCCSPRASPASRPLAPALGQRLRCCVAC